MQEDKTANKHQRSHTKQQLQEIADNDFHRVDHDIALELVVETGQFI